MTHLAEGNEVLELTQARHSAASPGTFSGEMVPVSRLDNVTINNSEHGDVDRQLLSRYTRNTI